MVSPTTLMVSEPSGSSSFTITLSIEPTSAVTIPLSLSNDECSISPDVVMLDSSNWNSGAVVEVTAVDDSLLDRQQTCTVQTGAASSGGTDYGDMPADDVVVTVVDDDTAAIIVMPTILNLSEPEGSATFALTLSSEPAAAVTIPLSLSNSECSISLEAVTLDSTNWSAGAIVTVVAVDDQLADGEQTCLVQTGAASSNGADYGGMQSDDLSVTVLDDDVAGIVVAPTTMTVNEPEGSGTFTVTLSSQPAAPVSIPLISSNDECAISPAAVTLDSTNWRSGAVVTVTAIDDSLDDGEQTCTVHTGAASSSGADYGDMPADDVAVIVVDDDTAGIVITPTVLNLREPDGSATFTLTLSSEPAAVVAIPLSLSNSECTISPEAVTLDSTNWRSGAIVTVTAVDDSLDDGVQACTVQTGAASSVGADYDGMHSDELSVAVMDDDVAGIIIAPTTVSLSEPEGSGTFTVTLSSQPAAAVSIPLSPSNDECTVSPDAVMLDSTNWRSGAIVTVTAVDDSLNDGVQACTVQTGAASSSGADYGGMQSDDLSVTVLDDDVAGIVVVPATLNVSEPEGSGTFTVTLSSQPAAAVSISLSPSNDECAVSPDAVTLDSTNWRSGAIVTVAAVDDSLDDGEQACTVHTGAASSSGADYGSMQSDDLSVIVLDDDVAGIVVVPATLNVSEPEGSGTFTVTLSSQPAAAVSIPLSLSNSECAVSPDAVTLDSTNWRTGAVVTVTAADDSLDDGEQTCTVQTGAASSAGADYDGLQSDDLSVTVLDDDVAGIVVAPATLNVSEPEGSGTFTVTLSSQPAAPVSIQLSPSNGECAVSPDEVTLDSTNWRTGAVVTVTAVDDSLDDGEQTCTVQTGAAGSSGADYGGMQSDDLSVTVLDDDAAGIVVAPTTLNLSEPGGSDTYTVMLGSEPTATVTVSITTDGQAAVNPDRLIFTNLDWSVQQPVTVSAVDDYVVEGEHSSTITHVTSSNDKNYDSAVTDKITAIVTDDDTAAVVAQPSELQVAEGGEPYSYELALSGQPTHTVIISITTDGQTTVTPTLLTFSQLQWNVPQTVTVTAVDDLDAEGSHSSNITHTVSSDDLVNLDGPASIVRVRVTDNEAVDVIAGLREALAGLIPSKSEEEASTSLPVEPSAEAEEGAGRLNPTRLLIVIVVALVIFAIVVEFVFRR